MVEVIQSMLADALKFPSQGESWLKTVLIGGVCILLGFLLVPILLVYGYLLRVLKAGSEDAAEPPVFDEWGGMLVDGLKVIAVSLVFFLIPIVVGLVGMALGGLAGGEGGALGVLFALIAFVAWILAMYLLPAGLTNMAREGSFGAAFDADVLRTVGSSSDYLVAIVLGFVIALILGSIASALMTILVGAFLLFYVQMAVFYLYGSGYRKATDGGTEAASTVGGARPTE